MPQEGSSVIMVSAGQLAVLQSFAESEPYCPSVQKLVSALLERKKPLFNVCARTAEALSFIDWLSKNQEVSLTVKDEIRERVNVESTAKPASDDAWTFYQANGGKRGRLPQFYRCGYFLITLLGHEYVTEWARRHHKFVEYTKTRDIVHTQRTTSARVESNGRVE